MAKKIYLSPSNQTGNIYTGQKTNECEQCNRIAEAAEKHLKRNGYEVKRAPKNQNMNTSINESNRWGADIHIPIHTNAGGGRGPLVMVYSKAAGNLKYADPVYKALVAIAPKGGGFGVRLDSEISGSLAEVRNTSAICVYCECEFHDNTALAKWIIENVDKIGEAICKGICSADGKKYIPESTTPTTNIYRVQVGAFADPKNAEKLKEELIKKGYGAIVVKGSK